MQGLPFTYTRNTEDDEVETTILLSTRLVGAEGIKGLVRDARRRFAMARQDLGRARSSLALLFARMSRAEKEEVSIEALEKLSGEIDRTSQSFRGIGQTMQDEAGLIVRHALVQNYGALRTDAILDELLPAELLAAAETLEVGQAPADFMPSKGTRPKSSSMSTPGSSPSTDSSGPDSPATTSKEGA